MIIYAQIQLIWKFLAEAFHREKYQISQNEGGGGEERDSFLKQWLVIKPFHVNISKKLYPPI